MSGIKSTHVLDTGETGLLRKAYVVVLATTPRSLEVDGLKSAVARLTDENAAVGATLGKRRGHCSGS